MSRALKHSAMLAGALAGVVCLLATAVPARAGTFTALTCHDLAGNAIGTRGWSVATPSGQYITFASSCADGGQGSFGLTMGPDPTSEYYNGNGDTMTYTVPTGLTITGYSLNLYAFGGPCVVQDAQCANGFGQVYVNHTGQSDPNYDYRNLGYGAAATTINISELSNVNNVTVGVSCDPGQDLSYPCSGSADPEAQALVSGGQFTILDSTVPSVTDVSGSLIAGGTLTGTDAINFTASDSGSGVYSAIVLIDGQTVADEIPDDNGGLCVNLAPPSSATMAFASPQPCASTEAISIPVNTTALSAGQHHLQVLVEDAAGDLATAYEGTITTSGPPLVAVNGGSINGGRGTPNGEPCAGEALELQVNGKRTPPVVTYGQPVTVRGVLHCGTVPIRNARIAVNTVAGPPSAATNTTVQTALDGSFSYKVPAGPNRVLRFSYTAYSNDPGPSATRHDDDRDQAEDRPADRPASHQQRAHDPLERHDHRRTLPAPRDHADRRGPRRQTLESLRPDPRQQQRTLPLPLPLPRDHRTHHIHIQSRAARQRLGRLPLHPRREQHRQRARRSLSHIVLLLARPPKFGPVDLVPFY